MRRKVLLLSPGYYEYGDYGYYDMPPMGLLKIARHFRSKGVDVEFIDFSLPMRLADTGLSLKRTYNAPFARYVSCGNYTSEGIVKPQKYYGVSHANIRQAIRDANPTEIWLSTGLTYYWESARDVALICKSEYPSVPLLVGGIYATLYPEHCQVHLPADYVHIGPLDDIDDLLPDYEVDVGRYHSTVRTLQLGKGCNVKPPCSFCAVVAMDPKFKSIATNQVLSYMRDEYSRGVNFFRFWSSQLLVPRSRMIALMRGVIDSGMKIRMIASEGVQPSLFDQEISDLMFKAGFASVAIPMESIDDDTVEDFRKPSDFNDYENAVATAQRSGFEMIRSFVMLGVPGQTYDEMVHAIVDCWARDVVAGLHQYTPIPGSYDWTRFKQFHHKSPEELHPSLWPGATDDMMVTHLEEIKKIARMGRYKFLSYKGTEHEKVPEIWDLYVEWCQNYGILGNDKTPLAIPGYVSSWQKYVTKESKDPSYEISRGGSLTPSLSLVG